MASSLLTEPPPRSLLCYILVVLICESSIQEAEAVQTLQEVPALNK